MIAIQEPSPKVLQVLLGLDQVNVNLINRHDESALMLASLKGLEPAARRLIERGADVNKTGWTPLHYAATGGHVGIMRLPLCLEHQPLHHVGDDVAGEGPGGRLAEGHLAGNRLVEILVDDRAEPVCRVLLQRCAGVHLVA